MRGAALIHARIDARQREKLNQALEAKRTDEKPSVVRALIWLTAKPPTAGPMKIDAACVSLRAPTTCCRPSARLGMSASKLGLSSKPIARAAIPHASASHTYGAKMRATNNADRKM